MAKVTISVTDNRPGRTSGFPIEGGTGRAAGLRTIKVGDEYFGLMTYNLDPHSETEAAAASSAKWGRAHGDSAAQSRGTFEDRSPVEPR